MYAHHEWTVVFFKLLIISWSSVTLLPTDAHRTLRNQCAVLRYFVVVRARISTISARDIYFR